jgi:hypothetical protein
MGSDGLVNQVRAFNFILGLLRNRQNDPRCGKCLSFAKNTETVKNKVMEFEKANSSEKGNLPEEFQGQFTELYELIGSIHEPDNPVGQRKSGNCDFPEKICIVQESMALYERLIS